MKTKKPMLILLTESELIAHWNRVRAPESAADAWLELCRWCEEFRQSGKTIGTKWSHS